MNIKNRISLFLEGGSGNAEPIFNLNKSLKLIDAKINLAETEDAKVKLMQQREELKKKIINFIHKG